ncbi:MAG: hypothetical protein HFI39_03705 [Lachnospiraceae bacterium]|nr:hypothetical protein [Lachnospiraceae bacterium]
MDEIKLNIEIPVFGWQPKTGIRHAYGQALCRELQAAAKELSEYTIPMLHISRAGELGCGELERLLLVLRKSLDLTSAWKVADIAPEHMNTANLTVLRNFRVHWYRIDFGAWNIVDFKAMKRPYDYSLYSSIKQLLHFYDMHNFSALLLCGLPNQKTMSLRDSLNRVLETEPDGICLKPAQTAPVAVTEELLAFGREFLETAGYRPETVYDYVKSDLNRPPQPGFYWGVGCGAVSRMEDVLLQNTPDPDAYLQDSDNLEKLIVSAVRLNPAWLMEESLRQQLLLPTGADSLFFERKYGILFEEYRQRLLTRDLAKECQDRLILTQKGIIWLAALTDNR